MPLSRVLILVGGGHAHVQVVKNLNHAQHRDLNVILISDSPQSVYSGMLPSVVAGITCEQKSLVDLTALCATNNIHFVHASVTRMLPDQNRIFFNPHGTHKSFECSLVYDYISINVGSRTRPLTPAFHQSPSLLENTHTQLPFIIHTRPISKLSSSIRTFEHLVHQNPTTTPTNIVVIGAGAAGIELALALDTRLRTSLRSIKLTVIAHGEAFASQFGRLAGNAVLAELRRRQINHIIGRTAISFNRKTSTLLLDDSSQIPFHLAVVATGAAPHTWMSQLQLEQDLEGWLLVRPTLQCIGHDNVFAAGDCASFAKAFGINFPPKAGVYAVRQGPVLTQNLEAVLEDSKHLKEYVPQTSFLSLLSTGDGRGIGSKYGLVFRGTWVYRLKNYIDESWQDKFRVTSPKANSQQLVSKPSRVEQVFDGTPDEGAAILHAAEDSRVVDSFEEQLMVLRRMDEDVQFREQLLRHVSVDQAEE